jgi:hypothetical protein
MRNIILCCGLIGLVGVLRLTACSSSSGGGGSNNPGDGGPTGDGSGQGGWDAQGDGPVQTLPDGAVVIVEPDGGLTWTCVPTTCADHLLECGDCDDDDGDGLVDSRDPECLGPCDNTEGPVLLAGVGGETGGPCRADCYFDFGNGPGNDDCHWDSRCDPLAVAPDFHPEGEGCSYEESRLGTNDCPAEQSDTCLNTCLPMTPNGCDCFGCCTFPVLSGRSEANGGEFVWIGSVDEGTNDGTCTFADVEDTSLCRPCTPVAECLNECGPCELCLGRTELPPECTPTTPPADGGPGTDAGTQPPGERCDPGVVPCGLPGEAPCGEGLYCITGCCISTAVW